MAKIELREEDLIKWVRQTEPKMMAKIIHLSATMFMACFLTKTMREEFKKMQDELDNPNL